VQVEGQTPRLFDLPAELREKIAANNPLWGFPTVTDLVAVTNGTVWLSTKTDLYQFAGGNWRHFTPADGLPAETVLRLTVDAQNQLWAVFEENDVYSLARFEGEQWLPHPLPNITVAPTGLAVMPSGEIWLSVPGKTPFWFDGSRWTQPLNGWNAGVSDMFLAANPAGGVWFGSDNGWQRWAGYKWQGLEVTIPAPFSYPAAVDANGGAWGIVTGSCYWCKQVISPNEYGVVYVTPEQSCRFTAATGGFGGPPLDPPLVRPDAIWDIAIGADGRVWFIAQGKIIAFSPSGSICDYAAPENVRTPEEANLSKCADKPKRFIELWQRRIEELGCPVVETDQPVPMVEQSFEHGWMLWRGDTAMIIALPVGQFYREFEDTWNDNQPAYSCPDIAPAQTPPTPQRGFGKIWCAEPELRNFLGQATNEERSFVAHIQSFERGLIFSTDQGTVYIFKGLLPSWERLE